MCITLVIYQESLHDARSTKLKKKNTMILYTSDMLWMLNRTQLIVRLLKLYRRMSCVTWGLFTDMKQLWEAQLVWTKSKYIKYLLLFSALEESDPVARAVVLDNSHFVRQTDYQAVEEKDRWSHKIWEVNSMQTHTQTPKDRCKYIDLVLSKCCLLWYKNSNYSAACLFNPYLMGSMLSMTRCYVAHGDTWN